VLRTRVAYELVVPAINDAPLSLWIEGVWKWSDADDHNDLRGTVGLRLGLPIDSSWSASVLDFAATNGDTQRVTPAPQVSSEGIVVEVHGMLVTLLRPDGERVRARPPRDRTTPVIGDKVTFTTEGSEHRVTTLAERERVFMRPNAQGGQVVAANIDRLVIVTAVEPGPRPGLIDRMLTALGNVPVEVILVLNKCDLPDLAAATAELADHISLGARLICTSARAGTGIDDLRAALAHGLSLIVGHSGVGKSSIVNALVPAAKLATGAVNDFTSKGRHTTTVATCHALGPDHLIVDTPGVRAFPLDGMPLQDVAARFPGFAEAARRCHFAHCMHESEEACAVRTDPPSQPTERIARYHALLASLRIEAEQSRAPRYPDRVPKITDRKAGGKLKAPPPRRR